MQMENLIRRKVVLISGVYNIFGIKFNKEDEGKIFDLKEVEMDKKKCEYCGK